MANAFFRAGEIEAWGRGIQRVLDACRQADAPEPTIRADAGELWVEFAFSEAYLGAISAGAAAADATPRTTQKAGSTTQKTTQKAGSTTQETTQTTTLERVLEALRDDPRASRRTIAERLGDVTADGVKYHLNKLKEEGRIRRVGPDRGGRWETLRGTDG